MMVEDVELFLHEKIEGPRSSLWRGQPIRSLYLRQNDLLSLSGLIPILIFVFIFRADVIRTPLPIAIIVIIALFYILIGRHIHDMYLRRQIRYELNWDGLRIEHASSGQLIKHYAPKELHGATLLWNGQISSIELSNSAAAVFTTTFNGWAGLVPSLYPHLRLELIREPQRVLSLLRSVADTSMTSDENPENG